MTPKTIDKDIENLIKQLNATHEPIYVEVKVEPGAELSECISNVEKQVASGGGRMILGWQIWKTKDIVEAELHAVWETPDEELVDITPKEFAVSEILFVEDSEMKDERKQVDNIRVNITKNGLVDDFITVSKAIFAFLNRGNRANLFELKLSGEELSHYKYMLSLKQSILEILESSGTRDSLCPCGSNRKFKNCHGKDLKTELLKVK